MKLRKRFSLLSKVTISLSKFGFHQAGLKGVHPHATIPVLLSQVQG